MKPKQATLALALAVLLALTGCGLVTTSTSTYYYNPSWLPDGRIICTKFVNEVEHHLIIGGQKDLKKEHYITTMNDDGSNEQNVRKIDSVTGGGEIAASPDGRYIAIASGYNIRVFNSDFSDYSTVTPSGGKLIEHLDFSPTSEGCVIVFSDADWSLKSITINGSNERTLASPAFNLSSRYGTKIVFSASQINTITFDGSIVGEVVSSGSYPQLKDQNNIIYMDSSENIYSIDLDGSSKNKIFDNYDKASLHLSFDGTKIVGGDLDGSDIMNVYVTNILTGTTTRLR